MWRLSVVEPDFITSSLKRARALPTPTVHSVYKDWSLQGQKLCKSSRILNYLFPCPLRHLIFAVYQYVPNKYPRCEFVPCLSRASRCHRGAPQTHNNFSPDDMRICRVSLT